MAVEKKKKKEDGGREGGGRWIAIVFFMGKRVRPATDVCFMCGFFNSWTDFGLLPGDGGLL